MTLRISRTWGFLAIAVLVATATGCRKDEAAQPAPQLSEGAKVILAKADLADGTADKVVSKCAGCSLRMDGSADHTLAAGEYSMHFCSDGCNEGFSKDIEKSILAMKVPE